MPQTDPGAGAPGGHDRRKRARAEQQDFRPRTRGVRARLHGSSRARACGSSSHESRAWRQPRWPSPARARAARGSWRSRKRKRWSRRGETAVTLLAREARTGRRRPDTGLRSPGAHPCARGRRELQEGDLSARQPARRGAAVCFIKASSVPPAPCLNHPHRWPLR